MRLLPLPNTITGTPPSAETGIRVFEGQRVKAVLAEYLEQLTRAWDVTLVEVGNEIPTPRGLDYLRTVIPGLGLLDVAYQETIIPLPTLTAPTPDPDNPFPDPITSDVWFVDEGFASTAEWLGMPEGLVRTAGGLVIMAIILAGSLAFGTNGLAYGLASSIIIFPVLIYMGLIPPIWGFTALAFLMIPTLPSLISHLRGAFR